MIIREGGRAFVRHDETVRFRATGQDVRVERRGGEVFTVVRRPGDVEIVTVVDENGRLLRRVRRTRDGREFVLIDNRRPDRADILIALPAPRIVIPREEYIVEIQYAPRERIFAALEAPPIERIERPYTLDEIRFSPALRDRMRRVDLDTINFEFGSWEVVPDQVQLLANIAEAMNAVIRRNPNEMFLIEGHTDAVGNDVDNLSLSDRRAESVALILTDVRDAAGEFDDARLRRAAAQGADLGAVAREPPGHRAPDHAAADGIIAMRSGGPQLL